MCVLTHVCMSDYEGYVTHKMIGTMCWNKRIQPYKTINSSLAQFVQQDPNKKMFERFVFGSRQVDSEVQMEK